MSERLPLVLDVDTGTDDALALAYAVAAPGIELVAVTTVAGNVGVEKTTANTLSSSARSSRRGEAGMRTQFVAKAAAQAGAPV